MHPRIVGLQSAWGFQEKGNLKEQQLHINVLEIKVVKLSLLSYDKQFQMKAIDFQIQFNSSVLSFENGGSQKEVFNRISKINLEVSPIPWD